MHQTGEPRPVRHDETNKAMERDAQNQVASSESRIQAAINKNWKKTKTRMNEESNQC